MFLGKAFGAMAAIGQQHIGDPGFEWYRYDTLSSLYHIDKLLTA